MTRESEKSKIRMSVIVDGKHINSLKKADEVIDQIFDEHEAQLKAKESDLERQDMIIKCLNIDLDNKEKLLKAKDEEIKELGEIVQQYLIPSKNYDAIIKAKDEEIERLTTKLTLCDDAYSKVANDFESAVMEIERLKSDVYHMSYVIKEWQGNKARSIVAMLFWMMKRQKAIYVKSFNDLGINNHNTSFYKGAYENSKMRFKQAYKMLKDNQ